MKSYIILTLLVAVAYANSLQNQFVWDDKDLIVNNPKINLSLKDMPSVFANPLWKMADVVEYKQVYRPVVFMFFALIYKIFGLNPTGFHLANITLHLASVIVLYRICLLLFNNNALISLIGASIFAVHPVHNEPVGRVASGDPVFGFFIIITIYLFLKDRRYLSLLTFFPALLSKEPAVMLPFALLILAIDKKRIRNGIITIIPYIALVGIYLAIRVMVLDVAFGYKAEQIDIYTRIYTISAAALDYIRLLIIPYPLMPFYPAKWYSSIFEPKVLIAMIILTLVFFLAYKIRKDKTMLFLLAFPFIMLVPPVLVVNTFPIDEDLAYITERALYVPAMMFSLFASAYSIKLFKDIGERHIVIGWILVMIIFTGITISSNAMWENDFILFQKIVKDSPEAAFARNNLGIAYANQGRFDEAIKEYMTALRIKPDSAKAHNNLGDVYYHQGKLDDAMREYLTALNINPADAGVHSNLGLIYYNYGRVDDAIGEYEIAIRIKPNLPLAHNNLGNAYFAQNRFDEATKEYIAALRFDPNNPEIHYNLGLAYKKKGMKDEARKEFEMALKLKPDFAPAQKAIASLDR